MKKLYSSVMALTLTASTALAITPREETPANAAGSAAIGTPLPRMSARQAAAPLAAPSTGLTFFEGFEARPGGLGNYYDEWLPAGWQDVSKSGQTVPGAGDYRHNLTWRVISNDDRDNSPTCHNWAFEGECFAFIMNDVAYGSHTELAEQDEWLIMPEVTPGTEDWLFFHLFYYPSWTTWNRATSDFTARNNQLEVYVTTDGGSHWRCLWNVVDDEITDKYTYDELRADLIAYDKTEYDCIYVDLKQYAGQKIQLAFRYFGRYGQSMAIDNVSVGVPQPVASYLVPDGYFKQGLSPQVDYPSELSFMAPFNQEMLWENTSVASQAYEWTYADASGTTATTTDVDLVTPAYPIGSRVATPSLVSTFESRRSERFSQPFTTIQAGGILRGTDATGVESEFGVGHYDIGDPNHRVVISSNYIGFNPELDDTWEMRLGLMYGSLDVTGYCNVYPASPSAYGFDFVDVPALIRSPVLEDSEVALAVYTLDSAGQPDRQIGVAAIAGKDVPSDPVNFINLHFEFPVPVCVPADTEIITLLMGFNREEDTVVFPYVKTTTEGLYGNSLLYVWTYDATMEGWYDTFYNLNNFLLNDGFHFAGLVQSLGVSYSWMELLESNPFIEAPMEGTTAQFHVRSFHGPARMAVTENGVTRPDWVDYTIEHDEATGISTVTLHILHTTQAEDRDTELHIVTPGSWVSIPVYQDGDPDASLSLATDPAANVRVSVSSTGNILVAGASGAVRVVDMSGHTVATGSAADGVIPASHLQHGIYVVSVEGAGNYKIVK